MSIQAGPIAAFNQIDSLQRLYRTATTAEEQLQLALDIAASAYLNQTDLTIQYASNAQELIQELDIQDDRAAKVQNLLGIAYNILGDHQRAINHYQKSQHIHLRNGNYTRYYATLSNEGRAYNQLGLSEKAFELHQRVADYAIKSNDLSLIASARMNLGEDLLTQEAYTEAEEYFEKALQLAVKTENIFVTGSTYQHLGTVHWKKRDFPKALDFYYQSLEFRRTHNDLLGLVRLLRLMALLNLELGMRPEAEELLLESKQVADQLGSPKEIFRTLIAMADFYKSQRQFDKAVESSQAALTYLPKVDGVVTRKRIYKVLASSLAGSGQFEEAYEQLEKHLVFNDSLSKGEISEQLAELELQYRVDQKESENQLLKAKQAEQAALIRQRGSMSIIAALALLIISIISYFLFRDNRQRKQNNLLLEQRVAARTEELEASNKKLSSSINELERFAYVSSHDLKEPLRNISGFIRLLELELGQKLNERCSEYFQFVSRNVKQMYYLIEEILEFRRLSKPEHSLQKVDLNVLVDGIIYEQMSSSELEQVQITREALPVVMGNSTQYALLFKHLIENGIKYNKAPHIHVQIRCRLEQDAALVMIKDNGIGIASEFHSHIFEMFTRLHNRGEYEGAGLGLAICKKIVELFDGEIWLESQEGKGSTFFLRLPLASTAVRAKAAMSGALAEN